MQSEPKLPTQPTRGPGPAGPKPLPEVEVNPGDPGPAQWSTMHNGVTYDRAAGEPWFGFDCVRALEGVGDDVLLVPLFGHTHGHCGVAVRREDDWLLLAGDAYFYWAEMNPDAPYCTPGLRLYQTVMEKDRGARLENQRRLRVLERDHSAVVTVLCSHDVREFEAASGHPMTLPGGGIRHGTLAAMEGVPLFPSGAHAR